MQNILNRIFICGFMGAGKTTVSKELAENLNFKFLDLDEQIEIRTKMKIPKIFAKFGENEFRKIESLTLQETVEQNENFILALGGGTLEKAENISFIQSIGKLIFLENSFEILWERIKFSNRPLAKNGKEFCQELFLQRQESYSNSSFKINCNQKSVSEIANEVYITLATK